MYPTVCSNQAVIELVHRKFDLGNIICDQVRTRPNLVGILMKTSETEGGHRLVFDVGPVDDPSFQWSVQNIVGCFTAQPLHRTIKCAHLQIL